MNKGRKLKIEKSAICVTDFCVECEKMWFISAYYNYLFMLDLNDWVVKKAYRLPYGRAFGMGEALFLYKEGDYINIVPRNNKIDIVKFNIDNCLFEKIDNVLPDEKWGKEIVIDDSYIYIPVSDKPYIVALKKDYKTFNKVLISAELKGVEVLGIKKDGFWLIEADSNDLIAYDKKKNEIKRYVKKPEGYKTFPGGPIYSTIVGDDKPILFPRYSNMILKIGNDGIFDIVERFDEYKFDYSLFLAVKLINNQIITYVNGYNCWRVYNSENKMTEEHKMIISEEVIGEILSENPFYEFGNRKESFVREDNYLLSVSDYIRDIINNTL